MHGLPYPRLTSEKLKSVMLKRNILTSYSCKVIAVYVLYLTLLSSMAALKKINIIDNLRGVGRWRQFSI